MACDASIIPVVLGAGSQILDIGRARRLFPPGILHAMWLRDKGCTIPGCGAPPLWVDAHHLIHWADGGPTALTNAAPALRATPHHRPPTRLDRHRHHQRSHLAPVNTQPHSPPTPAGLQGCQQSCCSWELGALGRISEICSTAPLLGNPRCCASEAPARKSGHLHTV